MKSVMMHDFSRIPKADIPRSVFNRSHGYKTTLDAGYLVPILCEEALPGDTFNLRSTIFARLSTPIFPIMDNMVADVHFFAVPYRLIWDNFQKFCGEQRNPGDSTDFLIPQIVAPAAGGWAVGTLQDYMGLPTGVNSLSSSALWTRAYNLIYREWYRDSNLINSPAVDTDDGPDAATDYVLRRRGKRHDYFTSALPWPQKGPAVELPLGTTAPVIGDGTTLGLTDGSSNFGLASNGSANLSAYTPAFNVALGGYHSGASSSSKDLGVSLTHSGLVADLSDATASSINALRQAFQLQRLYERDARGGTRYTELIRSHFGVVSPDARLQRPEYLGGTSAPVTLTSVAQTTPNSISAGSPMGSLAAIGTITVRNAGFSKSFTEHSVIIGLISVRSDLTYQQGLPRMFSRRTRWDHYWPGLAHLGEQSILNKEIYCQGTSDDNNVFGYQERWAEYRYYPSQITGQFRSTYSAPLDAWHLSQEFESLPTLSQTFIEENPPIDRVISVPSQPHFILDAFFDCKAARPMPVYSVPGMIDHF